MANIDITKEQFERALPVGTCGDDSLFEFVHPFIKDRIIMNEKRLLGEVGKQCVMTEEPASRFFAKLVCLQGFLDSFRQLDLVLTPTGFGVVSNDTTAPASKQRVDDLKEHLTIQMLCEKAFLEDFLCGTEGWGEQDVAKYAISYYYDYSNFCHGRIGNTSAQWYEAEKKIKEVDFELRAKISDEQMEEFLNQKRNGNFLSAHQKLVDVFDFFIDGNEDLGKKAVRSLLHFMESNPEDYSQYMNSNAYKINHFKNYENTKQAPAFFFLG